MYGHMVDIADDTNPQYLAKTSISLLRFRSEPAATK